MFLIFLSFCLSPSLPLALLAFFLSLCLALFVYLCLAVALSVHLSLWFTHSSFTPSSTLFLPLWFILLSLCLLLSSLSHDITTSIYLSINLSFYLAKQRYLHMEILNYLSLSLFVSFSHSLSLCLSVALCDPSPLPCPACFVLPSYSLALSLRLPLLLLNPISEILSLCLPVNKTSPRPDHEHSAASTPCV